MQRSLLILYINGNSETGPSLMNYPGFPFLGGDLVLDGRNPWKLIDYSILNCKHAVFSFQVFAPLQETLGLMINVFSLVIVSPLCECRVAMQLFSTSEALKCFFETYYTSDEYLQPIARSI